MSTVTSQLRPHPDQLAAPPTLSRLAAADLPQGLRDNALALGADFVLELKLATDDAHYWLCTQGLDEVVDEATACWVKGHVTPMYRQPDGFWRVSTAYGAARVAALHKLDYLAALWREYLEPSTLGDTQRLAEVGREIDAVLRDFNKTPAYKLGAKAPG